MLEFATRHSIHIGLAILLAMGFVRDYFQRRAFIRGAQAVQEASVALANPLREQIDFVDARARRCEDRLLQLENANERLFAGVGLLISQMRAAGIKPLWTPADSDRIVVTRGRHIEYQ